MTNNKQITLKFFDSLGKEIPFEAIIKEIGPDLYKDYISEILKSWKHSDWLHASDYIAPIAAQVIIDACELDKETFTKIMTVIVEAYDKLGPMINEPYLTLIK